MKNYFKRGILAQSSIEFTLGFVMAILFLYLTCNLFVWLNHSMVARQQAYENSRAVAASTTEYRSDAEPGKLDFYNFKNMDLAVRGGYR